MPRDAPAFPAAGEIGEADLAVVVRGVLCAAERPWSTVVLRGRWAGGRPLEELWRAEEAHAEGDGFVVVLDGGSRVLTVVRPRAAHVVHRSGTVSVTIASVGSAVLTDDGGVRPGSFATRAGVARDLVTGAPASWPRGAQPWRRRAAGGRPLPAVELVALI